MKPAYFLIYTTNTGRLNPQIDQMRNTVNKSRLLIEEWPFDNNYQYIFDFADVVKEQAVSIDAVSPESAPSEKATANDQS